MIMRKSYCLLERCKAFVSFLWIFQASFGTEDERRKVVDPIVLASCSQESLSVIISITKKCFVSDSWARPSFEDVLWHLQYAAQVQTNVRRPAV